MFIRQRKIKIGVHFIPKNILTTLIIKAQAKTIKDKQGKLHEVKRENKTQARLKGVSKNFHSVKVSYLIHLLLSYLHEYKKNSLNILKD